ncbi:FGGY-family carbohydrate kinase [Actinomycetospora termitidis]|uniref:FGGY-family carbohydrate kinase n=1 Tax=Actinomycetospora termitidis TaxID=3053470 RepID=A0ABT7MCB5_9PSEU|nr:FGGY-family carbohydrate kinase [Actinomycetospora sp. Odt1-22]MDL5158315.1 FGGY-family carbohydrate kinase [Actinomycetospora sp. Odt1-22]
MIIGVDVGTSMTKADAYDDDGSKLASAERASRLEQYDDGRVEQDLEDVLASAADVIRRVSDEVGDRPVRVLAITGQGDGLWLRDADGHATRPPISWLDDRAGDVVRRWQDDGTVHEVYRRTGSGLFPGCHAPLIHHLARHEPEALGGAAVAGYCVDALIQRLTGEITVDASDASLPFLDVATRRYDDAAIAACGIEEYRHLLADPAPAGTVLALDRRGAEITGLPVGTPVTGGPFDLPACAVGAGLSRPGDGLLIIGTTLACEVFTDTVDIGAASEPAGMWLCTPEPDRWLRAMPAMVGTAGLDWLLDFLGVGIDALSELLDGTMPGAGGVSALPFLSASGERAPFVDTRARGQVEGVTLSTTRGQVVRAVCEGIAYTARNCFERAAEASHVQGRLVACGGGSRSGPWAQIFADVLNVPLVVPDDPGLGTRGAAVTALRALGEDVDPADWAAPSRTVEPSAHADDCYEPGYRRYRAHVDTAREFWARQAQDFALSGTTLP